MEVFRIAPTAAYCGGAAYVAAKTTEEAIKTFCEILCFIYIIIFRILQEK